MIKAKKTMSKFLTYYCSPTCEHTPDMWYDDFSEYLFNNSKDDMVEISVNVHIVGDQSQESLQDQLNELIYVANKIGLQDAADWVKTRVLGTIK